MTDEAIPGLLLSIYIPDADFTGEESADNAADDLVAIINAERKRKGQERVSVELLPVCPQWLTKRTTDVLMDRMLTVRDLRRSRRSLAIMAKIAVDAAEALKMADAYLDGFVWVSEPECSELEAIKQASNRAQRRLERYQEAAASNTPLVKDDHD